MSANPFTENLKPERDCPACGKRVKRWTNGGRLPPHGKRTVRHKCPHGVWCPQGDPLWGTHSNGRQNACAHCREAYEKKSRAERGVAEPFVEPVKQPCNNCPFRRASMAGWLGAGSPESFIDCINRDEPLPCHQTINYEDPLWKEKWLAQRADLTGKMCAGALILTANMVKRPRNRTFPIMEPDTKLVFPTAIGFIAHHRGARVHSWDDADQLPEAIALRERLAPYVEAEIKKGGGK